jgi:two-component system cell cycle response regulator
MSIRRAWPRAALTVAFAICGVYFVGLLVPDPGPTLERIVDVWLYHALFLIAVAIAASRPLLVARDRLAWSLIALALASTAFGELYFLLADPVEFPSLADAGWLAFYPLLYVGIVLLLRKRARFVTGTLWLDGLTASVAAAALGSAVLVEVVIRGAEGSRSAIATNIAYPFGDVLLLSAVVGIVSLAGWRLERRWLLLALGLLATAIPDAIYLFEVDTYQPGGAIDVLWPLSSLLIAAAAWTSARDERALDVQGRPLLAVPLLCAVTAIGVLVVDHFEQVNVAAVALAALALALVLVRLVLTFRENARLYVLTRHDAVTDALTGLGNRRRLLVDLHAALEQDRPAPTMLMVFDLDGFKGYNDTFGHPAGDALLVRLGAKLALVPGDRGAAYRLGGDEFCVLVRVGEGDEEALVDAAVRALSEHGEAFDVSSSFGAVLLPDEAADASHALGVADERLYAQKRSRRDDSDRTMHVLLEALTTREPEFQAHVEGVASLSVEIGRRLGLGAAELDDLFRASQLYDLGKLAVPDEILRKRGPLDEREWEFIRQHTVVGERILRASPALKDVSPLVRSSHENWDGSGYPDGLVGEDIPLASRIIRVCDAFTAMTAARPYRDALTETDALAELEDGAGAEYDPTVARVVVAHLRERREAERAA